MVNYRIRNTINKYGVHVYSVEEEYNTYQLDILHMPIYAWRILFSYSQKEDAQAALDHLNGK